MQTAITVSHLGVYYRTVEALQDITLKINPGRLTGIIGPNGAGKSTLIKAMLGLISVHQGTVSYQGQSLQEQLDKVAYVPQRSQIDWTYPVTAWDVVMMGRVRKTGWFRPFSNISRHRALNALERVEMADLRHRPIGQLSGGQQQRVFLARSLAQEAEIFCFDEPFVGVDQKTEGILFNIFHELARENKIVMVVNHDLGESITNFDDLILLNKELIIADQRSKVLTDFNLRRAYGGKVSFYEQDYYPSAIDNQVAVGQ
jgi:manganese/iron transport system ATP-binding protein